MGKKEVAEKEAKEKKEAAEKAAKEKAEKEAKEKKEAAAVEGDDDEAGGDDGEHDDAAADKELIKKMIAEYVGDGKDGGAMDESEAMEMESLAKEAYEAHKEMGASEKEAYERAGHALKLAKHMACKQSEADATKEAAEKESKEAADKEAMESDDEGADKAADEKDAKADDKKKESDRVKSLEKKLLETQGKLAALSATLSKDAVAKYVDTKLAESKQPRQVTKQFLEAAGEIKSKVEFDSKWKMFQEGLKNSRVELDWGILQEKATSVDASTKTTTGKGLDFSAVAED